jgi:hypothetical protein
LQDVNDLRLQLVSPGENENLIVALRNSILQINIASPAYSKTPIMPFSLFSDITALYHCDTDKSTYVADIGLLGISVLDQGGALISRWTKVQRQSLTFSSNDFIMGVGGKIFFTTANRMVWRSVQ